MSVDCDCSVCAYSKKHPQLNARRCWWLVLADTITDDQIRESGADAETIDHAIAVDPNWEGGLRYWTHRHRAARAICATAWNARHATKGIP